jgi:hypothetical protein
MRPIFLPQGNFDLAELLNQTPGRFAIAVVVTHLLFTFGARAAGFDRQADDPMP